MSSTIAHVAANASSVNDIATQTKTLSSSAKDTIEGTSKDVSQLRTDLTETSNTINSLSEKCDRISQVMEAIKVVSEQTNLLALNAAIESARAGEHGRGFAVVADEVRQLAIKTRESVEEISEVSQALINDGNTSVGQMSQCLKSAEKAMEATSEACNMIDEVLAGITQVEASIGSVASSTEQQSMASSSIAASAQQLYDLSQQETASATQTLTEVEELRKHSETLEKQLSKFHV
jgi:methyl-accepting chemotaxis protein